MSSQDSQADVLEDIKTTEERHIFRSLLPTTFSFRCPNCRQGMIFKTYFAVKDTCEHCGVRFERESGSYILAAALLYFLNAIVVGILTLVLVLRIGFVPWLTPFVIVLSLATAYVLYRPSKALYVWLLWAFGFVWADRDPQ